MPYRTIENRNHIKSKINAIYHSERSKGVKSTYLEFVLTKKYNISTATFWRWIKPTE